MGTGQGSADGRVWQFLGYTADDGTVVSDATESYVLDTAGNRVDLDPAAFTGGQVVSFTVPLRAAGTAPAALTDARPRCHDCGALLTPCDACGAPAVCGGAWCAACRPR